jgi:hypothetical protein
MNYTVEELNRLWGAVVEGRSAEITDKKIRHVINDCLELHARVVELDAEVTRLTVENANLVAKVARLQRDNDMVGRIVR